MMSTPGDYGKKHFTRKWAKMALPVLETALFILCASSRSLQYHSLCYPLEDLCRFSRVILTNTTDFEFSKMNEYISKLILPVYNKKPVNDLNKYTGKYQLAGGYDSLRIYLRNGNLYSAYLQDIFVESPLISTGDNKIKSHGKGNYSIGYESLQNDEGEIKFLNLGQLMWVKH